MQKSMTFVRSKRENNRLIWVYINQSGEFVEKVMGIKCPYCGKWFDAQKDEAWSVEAGEHITYCNPAHIRAEYGERW